MKNYPLGIQTFSEIIERGMLYIDKTQEIYKLLQGKYYFYARPRRFGKSLMLSTIKAIYEGRRDLFKGLWIENKWEWAQKLDENGDTALQQIKDKGYAEKYYGDNREKILLGINFNSDLKTVDDWKQEAFK